jgi:glycosyltransferase involved in cell wall biosynthesis
VTAPVAINARAAVRREIGGVERVAREMAKRLPRLRPMRYRVLAPSTALAHRAGHVWEQGWLPLEARGSRLLYSPANLAPVASRRNVVVIHDLAALREPRWYGSFYAAYHRRLVSALVRRAVRIITDSEFSRRELVDLLEVPAGRIRVVPLGVGERFSPGADPGPVRARHALERPYVLAVATDLARKNLGLLQGAARRLQDQGLDLVVAGSGRGYMRGEETSGLRRLGYVEDDELAGLYAGASALAMPSLYEGFGLPCLEAMASGVPVVAADRTALPETCGEAALLVDPQDSMAFAEALVSAATDASVRERLSRAGTRRAASFTWQRTAELTDGVLGEVLSGIT